MASQARCEQVQKQLSMEQSASEQALAEVKRSFNNDLDDVDRHNRQRMDEVRRDGEEEVRRLKRKHEDELDDLRKRMERDIEDQKAQRRKEEQALTSEGFHPFNDAGVIFEKPASSHRLPGV